jgi:hypothetical protein
MLFNFFSLAALASIATTVSAQGSSCPEAVRFGNVNVSPSTLSPGEVTIFSFLAFSSLMVFDSDLRGHRQPDLRY